MYKDKIKVLIDYLLAYGQFNEQQIELISKYAHFKQLKKEAYFSEAGDIAKRVAFVLDGIFRVCYYLNNGDEVTRYFVEENNFVVDINSYINEVPSTEYIQAITPVEIIIFRKEDLVDLSNTIVGWDQVMSKITNKALLEKVHRISPMMAEDAKTRYVQFHDRFPNLVNRIPLNYLASYIGITKHSLSRIRKELSEKRF